MNELNDNCAAAQSYARELARDVEAQAWPQALDAAHRLRHEATVAINRIAELLSPDRA